MLRYYSNFISPNVATNVLDVFFIVLAALNTLGYIEYWRLIFNVISNKRKQIVSCIPDEYNS